MACLVAYLVAFYCDRLKDSALVTPHVFQGLYSMVASLRNNVFIVY